MTVKNTNLSTVLSHYALPCLGACAWLILGYWISSLLARLTYAGLLCKLGADKARAFSKGV